MTLPTGYRAWLSSIEDDVRVRDLTEDEIAGLVAATRPATDMAAVVETLEKTHTFLVMLMAFVGRDLGTDRFPTTLEQLMDEAKEREAQTRAALQSLRDAS